MKRSVKKKLIPFACGVGVLACAVTIWTYVQWRDTQTLFFDTAEQTAPSTELSPSADTISGWEETSNQPEDSSKQEQNFEIVSPSPEIEGETTSVLEENIQNSDSEEMSGNDDLSAEDNSPEEIPQVTETVDSEAQVVIDEAVAQLYVYQSDFLSALEVLYASAKEEYYALPTEERTSEAKESMMLSYAIEGSILESNCDSLVLSLLVNLTSDLEKLGASVEIVDQMQASYVAQKTEKKTEYMATLS